MDTSHTSNMNHVFSVGDRVHDGNGRYGKIIRMSPMKLAKTKSYKIQWEDDNSIKLFVGQRSCCMIHPVTE